MSCLTRITFGGLFQKAIPVSYVETACDSVGSKEK